MESNTSMVRWYWYNCNGNNLMPIMNVGGMQLFKISSNDSSEKILPKSKEIALRLIYIYSRLNIFVHLLIRFLE